MRQNRAEMVVVKILVPILMTLWAVGCISSSRDYSKMSAEDIAKTVSVTSSEFDTRPTVVAPPIVKSVWFMSFVEKHEVFLRGWKASSGTPAACQAYVDVEYTDQNWRFYESANLVGGDFIPATIIDRQVSVCDPDTGCNYEETVGIDLPIEMLNGLGNSPLQFRLNSQRGQDLIFEIPASYVKGFLTAIDQFAGRRPTQAVASISGTSQAPKARLGIKFVPVPERMASVLGVPNGTGVWILMVQAGSLAEKSGLKVGDVILDIDGASVATPQDVQSKVENLEAGTTITIGLWRARTKSTIRITL